MSMSIAAVPVACDETIAGGDPLDAVLARIRAEIVRVADIVEAVEPHLAGGGSGATPGPQAMRALQDVDLVIQKLRGLSDFLDQVQAAVPADCLIDTTAAASVVTLSDMKARLASRSLQDAGSKVSPGRSHAVGDVDLF
jgi:hypothetical protein